MTTPSVKYSTLYGLMAEIVSNLRILSGDTVPPSSMFGWQQVARDTAHSMEQYATLLKQAADGNAAPFLTFPSLDDAMQIEHDSNRTIRTFALQIHLGNDAIRSASHVGKALREISAKLRERGLPGKDDTARIMDVNGNSVGQYGVRR